MLVLKEGYSRQEGTCGPARMLGPGWGKFTLNRCRTGDSLTQRANTLKFLGTAKIDGFRFCSNRFYGSEVWFLLTPRWFFFEISPWKTNMDTQKWRVDGRWFSFFNWVIFWFQPFIEFSVFAILNTVQRSQGASEDGVIWGKEKNSAFVGRRAMSQETAATR